MNNYTFIDLETNGLPTINGTDQLIKIEALKLDKNFRKIDSLTSYIKPEEKLSEYIEQQTKITNEILEKYGENEKNAVEDLLTFIEDSTLISYNAKFDMTFILKAIYKNDIKDKAIYYFDLQKDINEFKLPKKTVSSVKEYYKITEENYLPAIIAITQKILEIYKYSDLEEYYIKKRNNKIRYPGLESKNTKIWVRFTKGNKKDNIRLIEVIDDSKKRAVGYLANYNGINKKITTLDELIEFKKLGAKTVDDILYFNDNNISYIDYYKIDSTIEVEKGNTILIEKLEKVGKYLQQNKLNIICHGTIEELQKNYSIIDKKIMNNIVSSIIIEIRKD